MSLRRNIGVFSVALLLLSSWNPQGVLARTATPYLVAKIKIDATASNAVDAKRLALEQGPQKALRVLLKRITHYRSHPKLPKISGALADDLVEDFAVYKERNSATRYIAVMQYRFQKKRIRELLRGKRLSFLERQAKRTTLIPVLALPAQKRFWQNAWIRLDLANALTPVHVTKTMQQTDPDIARVMDGSKAGLDKLQARFGTRKLVVAVASLLEKEQKLNIKIMGQDSVGKIDITQQHRIFDENVGEAFKLSTRSILALLENRWKQTEMLSLADPVQRKKEVAPDSNGFRTVVTPSGASASDVMFINIAFRGLREWQSLRSRLTAIPGLESMEVTTITARGADVRVEFPGGADRLSRHLSSYGMRLQDNDGKLTLHQGY